MGHRSRGAAIDSLYASLVGATLSLALFAAAPAQARGTSAGTEIANTATATYVELGEQKTVESDRVIVRVQEILDVVVAPVNGAKLPVGAGASDSPIAFQITNTGNGQEAFRLSPTFMIGEDDFDPDSCSIALDSNGNGTYDPGTDAPYVDGSNDPVLNADAKVIAFTLCDMPTTLVDGNYAWVDLYATAKTKANALDPKGTVYPAGADGIEAIVGLTTARAPGRGGYQATLMPPKITKSQTVRDRTGGSTPSANAVVTYTLDVELNGGAITEALVTDPIPTGTTYVPGSIELSADGTSFNRLTDAAGDDAGTFTGTAVQVALGDAPTTAKRFVRFQVRINQ